MNARTLARSTLCAVTLLLTACADLGLYPQVAPRTTGQVVARSVGRNAAVSASITVGEARRLAVANSLTGYRSLPPGIQRNLARGKAIPPGIARQMVPGGMRAGLPVVDGHEWRIAGTDLLLVALGTLIVVEVLEDVFQ